MNQIFSLNNKHIFITGASSGIGQQCAIICNHLGAKVTIVGRNINRLNETTSKFANTDYHLIAEDLTVADNTEIIVAQSVAVLGKINGLIHAAGIEGTIPFPILNQEKYSDFFNINVIAGLELAKVISKKKYIAAESLSFVFIASVMGILGQPGKVAYCASKGAIINAVKALSLELAPKKIRVNSISPGLVETPMTVRLFESISDDSRDKISKAHPLGIGTVDDIANAAAFLLSDASKWITGTNFIVDGGYSAQ